MPGFPEANRSGRPTVGGRPCGFGCIWGVSLGPEAVGGSGGLGCAEWRGRLREMGKSSPRCCSHSYSSQRKPSPVGSWWFYRGGLCGCPRCRRPTGPWGVWLTPPVTQTPRLLDASPIPLTLLPQSSDRVPLPRGLASCGEAGSGPKAMQWRDHPRLEWGTELCISSSTVSYSQAGYWSSMSCSCAGSWNHSGRDTIKGRKMKPLFFPNSCPPTCQKWLLPTGETQPKPAEKPVLQESGPAATPLQDRAEQRGGADACAGKAAWQLEGLSKDKPLTEHIFKHLIQWTGGLFRFFFFEDSGNFLEMGTDEYFNYEMVIQTWERLCKEFSGTWPN